MPSGILFRPTVWPQYTNDTQTGQDRQQSGSIWRTVLQTVARKPHVQTSRNFLHYILTVTVARPSLVTMQYIMYFNFVDDLLFSHNGPGKGDNNSSGTGDEV